MAFEEREEGEDEFNAAVTRIFQLKNQTARELMIPLDQVQMVPSHTTLEEARHLLSVHYAPMIPIFHRYPHNIVAIASLRDLLSLDEKKRVLETAHSPWFVTGDTSILQLLEQFRRNNQSIAVILDSNGESCGILSLDQILEQIFGEEAGEVSSEAETLHYVERTLSGDMSVAEFNRQFQANLPQTDGDTLSDLILETLKHPPVKGESVRIGSFEFTVDEPTLRGVKTLSVQSIQE